MFVSTSKLVELEFQLDSKRFDLANFDRWFRFSFPTESSDFGGETVSFSPSQSRERLKKVIL